MRPRAFLATTLLVVLLAGCSSSPSPATTSSTTTTSPEPSTSTMTTTSTTPPTPTPTTPVLGASDYALATEGVPASVNASDAFSFTLHVNGTPVRASDHIGAHYGPNTSTDAPTTAIYPNACDHRSGSAPGDFTVTCRIATPGLYYLRGHMRVNDSVAGLVNFWSSESQVLVVGNVSISTDIPATGALAHLNQPFTFTLYANATGNVSSDHVGAHYNTSSQASSPPSTTVYNGACTHQAGAIPGVFHVSCTFADATAPIVYLRGHVRLTDGAGKKYDFWGPETQVTVSPV